MSGKKKGMKKLHLNILNLFFKYRIITNAININEHYSKGNKKIESLDYRVDYYQAGLSMQLGSILKG